MPKNKHINLTHIFESQTFNDQSIIIKKDSVTQEKPQSKMNISHEQIEFNNELNKKKPLKNFVNQLLNSKNKQS